MTEEATTTEQTLEETIKAFVKENDMEAIVAKMVTQAKDIQDLISSETFASGRFVASNQLNIQMRDTVRNKFVDMLDGDKDATIEMNLEDINELLEDIGASQIVFTWSCDIWITANFTGIEANSKDEAREKVLQALELNVNVNDLGDEVHYEDEEYEVNNVQQDDNN